MSTLKQYLKNLYYIDVRQKKQGCFYIYIPLRHYCVILAGLGVIFCGNLYYKHSIFSALKQGLSFDATVINHYTRAKNSESFKLQDSNGNVFYATYRGKFKNLIGKKVRAYGKIYKCSFLQFLKSCRIYHSSISLLPLRDTREDFIDFIKSQHVSTLSANLYSALFFASTLDKSVRDTAIALGLAHLIAISGFHLASLMLMFFALVSPLYFALHRHFCHRNALYDLGFLGLVFAFCYLVLIDFEPSFLRAFLMSCAYYVILLSGLRVFSFTNLLLCVLIAIANNPSLLFHIGFILSVCGVFFIFLFVRHIEPLVKGGAKFSGVWRLSDSKITPFPTTTIDSTIAKPKTPATALNPAKNLSKVKRLALGILLFDCIIFLQMMPFAHYFFPYFSPYQLISIILSILFFLLFPLLIFAHLIRCGDIFDAVIQSCIAHDFALSEVYTPLWLLLPYILLCLLAIRYKVAYLATILFCIAFYIYNLAVFIGIL